MCVTSDRCAGADSSERPSTPQAMRYVNHIVRDDWPDKDLRFLRRQLRQDAGAHAPVRPDQPAPPQPDGRATAWQRDRGPRPPGLVNILLR